jgi:WD40 repeat protein
LRHPHIAAVHEVGEAGFRVWIAAEYTAGDSLAAWLRDKPAPVSSHSAAKLLSLLAQALEYSHQHGVLHRDLKPSNVLLEQKPSSAKTPLDDLADYTPKLIDFGMAKVAEETDHQTRTGVLVGTPAYMAPEQAAGQVRQIGPPTDVFALGVMLYELLARRPPFQGESDLHTLRQIVDDEPASLRSWRPDVSRDLEAICLKCLQKKPLDRYQSAGEVAADFERYLAGEPTLARPVSPAGRLLKWTRRRPALAGLLATSVAGSLAMIALAGAYIAHLRASNLTAARLQREAQVSAVESKHQERTANRYLYAARMKAACQTLEQGGVEQVAEILDRYNPPSQLAALRGFEWYLLKRRLHGELRTLAGHRGEVYAVAFAPDGRQLASGAQDGAIKFWDPARGEELSSIAAHKSCVNALAYSADGRILASGSCDHTIKLWDTATHQLLETLEGHPALVCCLAFAPGSSGILASGGNDAFARIWDLSTGEVVHSIDTKASAISNLAWRADGQRLIVAARGSHLDSMNSVVICHDLDRQHETTYPWDALAVAASPTGGDIFVGLSDTTIRKLSEDLAQPLVLQGHFDQVDALAVSPRGNWLASGGNRNIRIWDTAGGSAPRTLAGHSARVQSLAFSPREAILASAGFDGTVKLWDYESSDQQSITADLCVPLSSGDPSNLVAISSDFAYLALLSRRDEVRIYNVDEQRLIGTLPLAAPTTGLQFLAERPILFGLSIQSPMSVDEWDVSAWKLVKSHSQPAGASNLLARYGPHLVVTDSTGVTMVDAETGHSWRPPTPTGQPDTLGPGPPTLVLSPDGQSLGVYNGDRPGWLLSSPSSRSPISLAHGMWHCISNGSRLVAHASSRISVALVDAPSGRELATLRHDAGVVDAAFSPDDRTLAVGCLDGSVCLWSTATGQEMMRLQTRGGEILKVQFSADGRRLAVVSSIEIGNAPSLKEPNGDGVSHDARYRAQVLIWSGIDAP